MEEQDKNFIYGKSDWTIIKKVKEAVNIPVIGNGDITNEDEAKKMLDETGCDGIMIGRASIGNPWIFENIKYFLKTGNKKEPVSNEEKISVLKEHFELLLKYKGEYTATREIRKFISYYVKGMPNATNFKTKINTIDSKENFYNLFK